MRSGLVPLNRMPAPMAFEFAEDHEEVRRHIARYAALLGIDQEAALVTVSKRQFEQWLGRRVGSSLGGAYIFSKRLNRHLILVNLPRLNPESPRAVELVVAEELIHLRDWSIGDRRRHARHGYDRIAHEVSRITGATLEDVRSVLAPAARRPLRWVYACPGCGSIVRRRRKGTWSCGRCSPGFDPRFVLQLVGEVPANG
jgi:predicted SprT family Zn-dependent metalloprotease